MAKTTFTTELLTTIRTKEWRERELDLSYQELKPQEVVALADALDRNPFIQSLNLHGCKIGDAGAQALAGNTTLTTLNVSFNGIGPVGAQALAGNTTLTTLNVSGNGIGPVGTQALAGNKTLTTLNVSFNGSGFLGAQALAGNRTLTTLDVSGNEIGKDLQQQLKLVLTQNRKRLSNQAGLAVAVAYYRANLNSEINKASAVPLISIIHELAGFEPPTVAMGGVVGKNFFKGLVHIPPSAASQKTSSSIEQESEANLLPPTARFPH